ncbi:hypothetical protein ACFW93_48360 [Streptomyces canus]|uniref:hypothetical protein n=1 Tax=Streptomyces canus TaxID=58343 RepID=UPI00368A3D63
MSEQLIGHSQVVTTTDRRLADALQADERRANTAVLTSMPEPLAARSPSQLGWWRSCNPAPGATTGVVQGAAYFDMLALIDVCLQAIRWRPGRA